MSETIMDIFLEEVEEKNWLNEVFEVALKMI